MIYDLEEVAQIISMPFDAEISATSTQRLSNSQNLYFFRLEYFLSFSDEHSDRLVPVRFRRLCLREGAGVYPSDFMDYLGNLPLDEWRELYRLTAGLKLEYGRQTPIGMPPEEVEEAKELLRDRRRELLRTKNPGFGTN